jgi:hypothetical protein
MEATHRMRFPGGILTVFATILARKKREQVRAVETVYLMGEQEGRFSFQPSAVSKNDEVCSC